MAALSCWQGVYHWTGRKLIWIRARRTNNYSGKRVWGKPSSNCQNNNGENIQAKGEIRGSQLTHAHWCFSPNTLEQPRLFVFALLKHFQWVVFPGLALKCESPETHWGTSVAQCLSPECLLGFQGSGSKLSEPEVTLTFSLTNSLSSW